jgi:AI-2 transport protein TqsA
VLGYLRGIDLSHYLTAAAGQAGNLLSASTLVTLFVTFLFAERVWFPTKLEYLFQNREDAQKTRQLMGVIMRRVNYYLLVKTGISAATGVLVFIIMVVFGLQFAMPMGVLSFVLNFLPSIGSIISTVLIVLVTYIQTGGSGTITVVIFIIVGIAQFGIGNFLDPMLMGRTLRMSTFGIIISLSFWGAVWGIAGMFLAVPITVAVMVVCSHVPALRPVAILLSREGLPEEDLKLGLEDYADHEG